MSPPYAIVLNGTSSAGKTSIARWLQMVSAEPLVYVGLDQWLMTMPMNLHGSPDGPAFHETDEGVVITLGPTALRILSAWHHAQASLLASGLGLAIDDALRHFIGRNEPQAFARLSDRRGLSSPVPGIDRA